MLQIAVSALVLCAAGDVTPEPEKPDDGLPPDIDATKLSDAEVYRIKQSVRIRAALAAKEEAAAADQAAAKVAAATAAAAKPAETIMEFYNTHNPEAIASGQVDTLLTKYQGREDKLLQKLDDEYRELQNLGVAWRFKWLRGTVWNWAAGGTLRSATFGRDGRFLWGDQRCREGKCSWSTTQTHVQVWVAPDLTYKLPPPPVHKSSLVGAAVADSSDTVTATFVSDGERGQVIELMRDSW